MRQCDPSYDQTLLPCTLHTPRRHASRDTPMGKSLCRRKKTTHHHMTRPTPSTQCPFSYSSRQRPLGTLLYAPSVTLYGQLSRQQGLQQLAWWSQGRARRQGSGQVPAHALSPVQWAHRGPGAREAGPPTPVHVERGTCLVFRLQSHQLRRMERNNKGTC